MEIEQCLYASVKEHNVVCLGLSLLFLCYTIDTPCPMWHVSFPFCIIPFSIQFNLILFKSIEKHCTLTTYLHVGYTVYIEL